MLDGDHRVKSQRGHQPTIEGDIGAAADPPVGSESRALLFRNFIEIYHVGMTLMVAVLVVFVIGSPVNDSKSA